MSTYMLRNVPPDLWTRVQERARADGWPLRPLILELLERYSQGAIVLPAPPGRPDDQREKK